jgi:3-hydroxyanthranilate 3,4-dioxygenase
MFKPINIKEWVDNNSHLLQPPVNNYCLYNEKDFTVMLIGGPNVRRDYHVMLIFADYRSIVQRNISIKLKVI